MSDREKQSVTKPNPIKLAERIWRHPRAVIREVVDYDPWYGQKEIVLVLSGVSGLLALPSGVDLMFMEVILNLIILILSIYSMAWLLWITGKPMGGKANMAELCASMTWPMIPAIWGTLFALPLLGADPWGDLVQLLLYLYSYHLMVETVAEVQGFSKWRSFFNQLFALILSLLPCLFFWDQIRGALTAFSNAHF